MDDRLIQRLVDGAWVGIVPVGRDLLGHLPSNGKRLAEEPPRRVHVPPLAEQRFDKVALTIDRTIQVAPAA